MVKPNTVEFATKSIREVYKTLFKKSTNILRIFFIIYLYSPGSSSRWSSIFSHAFLPSMNPLGITLGVSSSQRCLFNRNTTRMSLTVIQKVQRRDKYKKFQKCKKNKRVFFRTFKILMFRLRRGVSLFLNSWKGTLLGNPCLQILMPSSTPLHFSWSSTQAQQQMKCLNQYCQSNIICLLYKKTDLTKYI